MRIHFDRSNFFSEDVKERLASLKKKKLGLRKLILKTQAEADFVWSVRKAGLSLLTGCKGSAKPACFIGGMRRYDRRICPNMFRACNS